MESFLRWKLTQTGTILGGSSLQKPISSFQSKKLPDVCSSFYSIQDEPFPQVSGFLDDTVEQSFLANEAGTALNSPACVPSEKVTKHKEEGDVAPRNETANISDLNFSMPGVCSHLADESTSSKSLQNVKDITNVTASKAERNGTDFSNIPTVSITSFEKSDFISAEKNSTFKLTQDLKERSGANTTDTINATVDVHNIKNTTFESVQSQEPREGSDTRLNSTVDIDVAGIKSGNATIDLVQSPNTKEDSDTDVNATVDIPNLDCTHDKINSYSDNSGASNTTTERPSEKHDGTIDIQPHELEEVKQDGSPNSTRDAKINHPLTKIAEEANVNVNVTVEIVEQMESAAVQSSGDVESSSVSVNSGEVTFTKLNTTTELSVPDVPILKNTTIEIKTETTSQASDVSKSVVGSAEPDSNNRETEVEISTTAFVPSVETASDSLKIKVDECPPKTSKPGFADAECVQNSDTGNISRSSIFCLDDTLDMRTSFMVTSTPIVFGKESRFEILRDVKPTPMQKRLSVINSIEAHSNDELVGTSRHDGTVAVQVTQSSNRSQKVSTHCVSGTAEPANENKPPTKPIVKRQLPQLSSKLRHPKSGLPPRPQSSMNSAAAVRPKTIQVPNVQHQSDASSSSTLLGNKKAGQLNKVKNIGNVKNAASAGPVKVGNCKAAL